MEQSNLFGEQHRQGAVRHSDPRTSKAAAKSVDANNLEQQFLDCLRRYGPCTAEEVTDYTGIPIDSTTPRTRPLANKGLIADSGQRRPGASGRNRIVWKLAKSASEEYPD